MIDLAPCVAMPDEPAWGQFSFESAPTRLDEVGHLLVLEARKVPRPDEFDPQRLASL